MTNGNMGSETPLGCVGLLPPDRERELDRDKETDRQADERLADLLYVKRNRRIGGQKQTQTDRKIGRPAGTDRRRRKRGREIRAFWFPPFSINTCAFKLVFVLENHGLGDTRYTFFPHKHLRQRESLCLPFSLISRIGLALTLIGVKTTLYRQAHAFV